MFSRYIAGQYWIKSNKVSVHQSLVKEMPLLSRRKSKRWQKTMFHPGTDYVKLLVLHSHFIFVKQIFSYCFSYVAFYLWLHFADYCFSRQGVDKFRYQKLISFSYDKKKEKKSYLLLHDYDIRNGLTVNFIMLSRNMLYFGVVRTLLLCYKWY